MLRAYLFLRGQFLLARWLLCFFAALAPAFAAAKVLPVLNSPIADRAALAGSPLSVNLNSAFGTEAIDDQVVRFTSDNFISGGVSVYIDMAIFSTRTPSTRQNFLNYVNADRYVKSFIHRSVPGFVIQGGGIRVNANNAFEYVPVFEPIINEFGISNTLGTISMAKSDGNANSATSQWFVSMGANSAYLDAQNGGFTVFGRLTKSTLGTAQTFGSPSFFPVFNFGAPLDQLPLYHTHVIGSDISIPELILFTNVALIPLPAGEAGESTALTYSVADNTNPALATASVGSNGTLEIVPASGQTGSTTVTVRATDSVGNTVDDSFLLYVNLTDNYATWATRTAFSGGASDATQNPDADAWNNLQEFAFLGDPAAGDRTGEAVYAGTDGTGPRFLTLTFPVRKATTGLRYSVEAASNLSGTWTEIWKSADGFAAAQVASAVDEPDRTVVTIKDVVAAATQSPRFLRVRVVQE